MNKKLCNFCAVFFVALLFIATVPNVKTQTLFDQYGEISWAKEQARLFNFDQYLRHYPDMVGYIVFNWSRQSEMGKMKRRAIKARNYLIRDLKMDDNRVVVVKGTLVDVSTIILQPIKKGLPPPVF